MTENEKAPVQGTDEELQRVNAQLERRVHELTEELARCRAELEATARKLQVLEQFAYVASHDLREPLRTLKNYPKLLIRRHAEKVDLATDDFMQRIITGADNMDRLICDLSEYSRVAFDAWNLAPTDCGQVFNTVCSNLGAAIQETGATITSDPLPTVSANQARLTVLFQHLLHNAVKFRSPDRPVQIHVGSVCRGADWLFSVRDNGIGIEPQYLDRLFTKIGQEARLHTRSKYPGTGFGLAICGKVVEGHGGRIWVTSEPGQGSTFYFTLPAPTAGT